MKCRPAACAGGRAGNLGSRRRCGQALWEVDRVPIVAVNEDAEAPLVEDDLSHCLLFDLHGHVPVMGAGEASGGLESSVPDGMLRHALEGWFGRFGRAVSINSVGGHA